MDSRIKGHLAAVFTIIIWGTTFVSTKILLQSFQPTEILCYRICIGIIALLAVYPKRMGKTNRRQELTFAAAGLCGITLYQLFENIALTYTAASNVGIIVSLSPFFTGLLAPWLLDGEKPGKYFIAGFMAAIAGIVLISYNGQVVLQISPKGDVLTLLAAFFWALYSILSKKISQFGFPTVQSTRKVFGYGLLFMIPAFIIFRIPWNTGALLRPLNLGNILFLGLGASAMCFVTWNMAVRELGAVKTSTYIYLVPVVTVITSVVVLRERITWMSAAGMALALAGLFISEKKEIKLPPRYNCEKIQ